MNIEIVYSVDSTPYHSHFATKLRRVRASFPRLPPPHLQPWDRRFYFFLPVWWMAKV